MTGPPESTPSRRPTGAVALIIVGAVLFALQFSSGSAGALVLLLIGAGLLVGYLRQKSYGLLIPACILLGLGLGGLADHSHVDMGNFGLGLGFLAIFIIDTMVRGRSHWWPLIPGGILLLSSLSDSPVIRVITKWWPLILVLVGVLLLLRNRADGRGAGGTGGASSGGDGGTPE